MTVEDRSGLRVGDEVQAFVKVGDLELHPTAPSDCDNVWEADVVLESYQGGNTMVKLKVGSTAFVSRQNDWVVGQHRRVFMRIPPTAVRCFPAGDT
jgi:hypothetical protein